MCHAPFLQGVPVAIAECRYSSSTHVSHRPVSWLYLILPLEFYNFLNGKFPCWILFTIFHRCSTDSATYQIHRIYIPSWGNVCCPVVHGIYMHTCTFYALPVLDFSSPEFYTRFCLYPVHTLLVVQVMLSLVMLGEWVCLQALLKLSAFFTVINCVIILTIKFTY